MSQSDVGGAPIILWFMKQSSPNMPVRIAVLEWTIAMLFTFYVFTYYYDLRLSKGIRKGELHALRNGPSAYSQRA